MRIGKLIKCNEEIRNRQIFIRNDRIRKNRWWNYDAISEVISEPVLVHGYGIFSRSGFWAANNRTFHVLHITCKYLFSRMHLTFSNRRTMGHSTLDIVSIVSCEFDIITRSLLRHRILFHLPNQNCTPHSQTWKLCGISHDTFKHILVHNGPRTRKGWWSSQQWNDNYLKWFQLILLSASTWRDTNNYEIWRVLMNLLLHPIFTTDADCRHSKRIGAYNY